MYLFLCSSLKMYQFGNFLTRYRVVHNFVDLCQEISSTEAIKRISRELGTLCYLNSEGRDLIIKGLFSDEILTTVLDKVFK